ncbi:MAG: hypothetical protein AB8B74_06800 [Crocinitomicaceae bacterium]
MSPEIQKLEDSIKRVNRIGFTPKFKDSFQTKLSISAFIAIGLKTVEKIGWDIVYYDETSIEAKRKNDSDSWTEKITIIYDTGNVNVQSVSLGQEMIDFGKNSKRVKLFHLVYIDLTASISKEEIIEFTKNLKKESEWTDYIVPESLPAPKKYRLPNIYIPILGALITSLLLGYILSYCIGVGFYIIGLFDIGIGFIIGFMLSQLIKLGNYTHYGHLRVILIGSLLIILLSCQIFLYINFPSSYNVNFISYMKLRLDAGLIIKNLNTGWIGLVLSWFILLFFGYLIGLQKLIGGILIYQMNRVPDEVTMHTYYLFAQGKSDDAIRTELSKYGWSNSNDQDYVFETVAANQSANDIGRSA